MSAATSQTFYDHVRELRTRLAWCFLALAIGAGVAYWLRVPIVAWIQRPLHAPLFYFHPAGSFNFVIKIAASVGILATLPVLLYHTVRFIEPALPLRIRPRLIVLLIAASFGLSIAGIAFAYYWMLPQSLHFFAGYSSGIVKPLISTEDYLSYIISMLLSFALIFQIPLLILFINRIWPISPKKLLHYQRHIIVAAFALAVVLPFTYDPISQFIIAIPIVFLYYLSIVLLGVFGHSPAGQPPIKAEVVRPSSMPTPRQQGAIEAASSQVRRRPAQPWMEPTLRLDGLSPTPRSRPN